MDEESNLASQPANEPAATFIDGERMGGVDAVHGFSFQDRYALIALIHGYQNRDFTSVMVEGAEDVDIRFDPVGKAVSHRAIQLKNYRVISSKAREIIDHFRDLEKSSPGTWTYTIACAELDNTLKSIRRQLDRYRNLGKPGGYEPDSVKIMGDTREALRTRIAKTLYGAKSEAEEAGFFEEAELIIDKVSFEPDLKNYEKVDWVRSRALTLLQETHKINVPAAERIYLGLRELVAESTGMPITRQDVDHVLAKFMPDDSSATVTSPAPEPPSHIPETVAIPAGAFWMGAGPEDAEAQPWEGQAGQIELPAYSIGKFPVTNEQYLEFVQATEHRIPAADWPGQEPAEERLHHPVSGVSWHDAQAYCHWLSARTGRTYRLPSEAQWEKAARGDDDRRIYPWGDSWENGRCNHDSKGITTVDAFARQSPFGCCDMVGNVREWTTTLWGSSLHEDKGDFSYPWRPNDGRDDLETKRRFDRVYRIHRGGSAFDDRSQLRCSARDWDATDFRSRACGFRVVLE